jgi:hypothetical protein
MGYEIGASYVIRQDLPRIFARRCMVHDATILTKPGR